MEAAEQRKGLVPEEITKAEDEIAVIHPDLVADIGPVDADIEQPKPYEISDEAELGWVLERMRELQADLQAKQRIADEQIQRAKTWLDTLQRQSKWRRKWWERAVENFARKEWEGSQERAKGKGRTISLPAGQVALRMEPPQWEYDEPAVLDWLRENAPALIRVKTEVDKAMLKRTMVVSDETVCTTQGEVVEGVRVVQSEEPTFKLRLAESEASDA